MPKAFATLGNSNCWGSGTDWRTNPSPPSGPSLARLKYWVSDTLAYVDTAGAIVPLDFDPTRMDTPTSATDWCMSGGCPGQWTPYNFGPEVYSGLALADFLATNIHIAKIGVGGSSCVRRDTPGVDEQFTSWFWPGGHQSWDPTLPRSATPYAATTNDTGTASATTLSTLTDGSKSWVPNEHKERWVTIAGSTGKIVGNTSTVLTVAYWYPAPFGPAPTPGAYVIATRRVSAASLSRTLIEGYCPQAQTAAGGLAQWDLEGVFVVLNEIDGAFSRWSSQFKDNLLRLMWYIRNTAVSTGLTSRLANEIKFVFVKSKVSNGVWPFAADTNRVTSEIAAGDPYCAVVEVEDLAVGFDNIHWPTSSMIEIGKRAGNAMIGLIQNAAGGYRKSIRYPGCNVVVRPVWQTGLPVNRLVPTFAELAAMPSGTKRYPSFYLLRDGGNGTLPVYLGPDGRTLANRGPGTLLGYARIVPGPGMVDVASLSLQSISSRVPFLGSSHGEPTRGWGWPAGVGDPDLFDETQVTVGRHVVQSSGGLAGAISRLRTTSGSIDREWLLRGARGTLGLAATFRIDERVVAGTTWMRHQLGWGDYHVPQTLGVGGANLAPSIKLARQSPILTGAMIPMEAGADDGAPLPAGFSALQLNHGGGSGLAQAVLWPDCEIRHTTEFDWRGIAGCIRIVHQVTLPFGLHNGDEFSFEPGCYAQNTFDKQFVYDPATSTETDLTWDPTTNRYHEITGGGRTTFNKNDTVNSTGASWFTRDAGLLGWSGVGTWGAPADGLTWAFYATVGPALGNPRLPTVLRLGNWTEPLVGPDGGFASYDQRNFAYARQYVVGTGSDIPAGTTFKIAVFLLVGTIAQVKAIADQLFALGVNATWVD